MDRALLLGGGNQFVGVGLIVRDIARIVMFSWVSAMYVCLLLSHIGAYYSTTTTGYTRSRAEHLKVDTGEPQVHYDFTSS